eukprot:CAMPEP_0203738624 /NCGR_PEP_ID=MMETSP0092-20131115/43232_1 /ASSEMBLY_ACC=CAM_ASM_001090 /TAXON_ID=426623 /ORGANISM="Chaetoceros affinis, Strain CCMP159" /LENGTH=344 /DNA_ID=CAMNT_0050624381 /DNA_START=59 /DNA_END=1093 /DNA_ORIENTATION=+
MTFFNSATFLIISFFFLVCFEGTLTAAFSPSPTFFTKPYAHTNTNDHKTKVQSFRLSQSSKDNNDSDNKSSIDVMMGKVDIPDEYKEEIFKAEANTPAAKDRTTRTAIYACIALLGIGISSFNAFLTNIRDGADLATDLSAINELGFGWVGENPFTSFLFLNKLGGGLALLSAGLGGTMVELEQRTKNENAEKIWAELQRRKAQSEGDTKTKKQKKRQKSNKKMSKKNRKRLNALSEVIVEDVEQPTPSTTTGSLEGSEVPVLQDGKSKAETNNSQEGSKEGIFGKVKNFYDKADQMAQSQALLLNKELEDRGVLDKITDETGLKVVGKEEAEKLQKTKTGDSE